ncbi:MAG TPA: YceD family protein [Actinocrinis sp.]|nr:YceD family protein [Actinocrinis sp.]
MSPEKQKPRRLNARSPFVLDVRELGHRPGAMRELERELPAVDLLSGAGGLDAIYTAESADLELQVRLESVMEGVLATGVVAGSLVGECVRCLDPVEVDVNAEFQELFYYDDDTLSAEEAQEAVFVVEELLDLQMIVHDGVRLDLPLQPLCEPDCPGLCSECGARLADEPGHGHAAVDPRWAALAQLKGPDQDL